MSLSGGCNCGVHAVFGPSRARESDGARMAINFNDDPKIIKYYYCRPSESWRAHMQSCPKWAFFAAFADSAASKWFPLGTSLAALFKAAE